MLFLRRFMLLSGWLAATAGGALAGPPEDFAAGEAAFRQGDVRGAIARLKAAADAGHPKAQALLGTILDRAERDEEAVRYFRLAADQNDADGAYGLAGMYASGEGVPRDIAQARQWMEKAASLGHRDAVNTLATAYLRGGLGVSEPERSSPAALDWIRRAADGGHLPALERLALAYRKGELGLVADSKVADELDARVRKIRGVSTKPQAPRKSPPRQPGNG